VIPAEVVLDASAVVRGLLRAGETAAEVVDRVLAGEAVASAPDIVVAEVTNALAMYVHAERWPVTAARERLETFLSWPLALHDSGPAAGAALEVAVERGLSAYDAFYAVIAEALEIPLVTADRGLAAAVPGALLVA
jgi:predicted nucleic acid-binding protein